MNKIIIYYTYAMVITTQILNELTFRRYVIKVKI